MEVVNISTGSQQDVTDTHRDKNGAPEETVPRIFRVICVALIQEDRPMVTRNCHFPATQFLFNPAGRQQKLNQEYRENILSARPIQASRA
jgi:hypothetical protein